MMQHLAHNMCMHIDIYIYTHIHTYMYNTCIYIYMRTINTARGMCGILV